MGEGTSCLPVNIRLCVCCSFTCNVWETWATLGKGELPALEPYSSDSQSQLRRCTFPCPSVAPWAQGLQLSEFMLLYGGAGAKSGGVW